MKAARLALLATALALPAAVQADTFGSAANTFTIDFVTIGNPGNGNDRALDDTEDTPDDIDPNDDDYASPYGGVTYIYRIGVTEVPQEWIDKATASGLLNVTAGAWTGSQPATLMTWYEAAAFVNWLNTSTGHQAAYNLNGTATAITLWSSADAWQVDGENRYRHKDAYYFLPSDDEWHKAAYHKNDGVTANYWDYATGSNREPTPVASGTAPGTAVYHQYESQPAAVNNAGGLSPYGTRGQNGNVYEWAESAADGVNDSPFEYRRVRSGHHEGIENALRSSAVGYNRPDNPLDFLGLRIASVPEPSSALLLAAAGGTLLLRQRR